MLDLEHDRVGDLGPSPISGRALSWTHGDARFHRRPILTSSAFRSTLALATRFTRGSGLVVTPCRLKVEPNTRQEAISFRCVLAGNPVG